MCSKILDSRSRTICLKTSLLKVSSLNLKFLSANDIFALYRSLCIYSTRDENHVISPNELILRWEKRGGGGASSGSNFSYGRAWISARTVHYAVPFILVSRRSSLRRLSMSRRAFLALHDGMLSVAFPRVCRARLRVPRRVYHLHTEGTTFAFITILRNSRLISCSAFPPSGKGWVASCEGYYLNL